MKTPFLILVGILLITQVQAQTNSAPVRLAILPETAETQTAADVLTAEFTKNGQVQLLERAEIDKVYREQGLSAANRDYLKLGQILGADGLLLLDVAKTAQTTNLTARLIAVKPGVVLLDENFPWPLKDIPGWAPLLANHLSTFFPKLKVLAKDAIPISIVNLRSAVQSDEANETERQLKLLAIQRLSREPQFFVLERQRMALLTEENNLKLEDSAFWKGSYLFEGVADQNGYSKEIITINARLTPPKGGAPPQIEVRGSRTNLAEVINLLAAKVSEVLKAVSTVKEWNAADEAQQYFEEAKWAVKWGVYSEAETAAESAWALGKQDMDCAIIRIKAYSSATSGMIIADGGGYDQSIINNVEESNRDWVIRDIKREADNNPGITFAVDARHSSTPITCLTVLNSPTSQNLDRAIRALDLYREFSQTLPPAEPRIDSPWYVLGVGTLTAAAQVLQHYYLVPKSQDAVLDKLAELRALARSVSIWISKSPSVHASYFVTDPDPEKERRKLMACAMNIYQCEADLGCFWQETPEDCIALHRDLLSGPAFPYLSTDSWGLARPRLLAWKEEDRKRIPIVWGNFVRELNDATNSWLQAEAQTFKKLTAFGLNATEITAKYDEYWQGLKSGKRETWAMETQKKYLAENTPWNSDEFDRVFSFREYTAKQALEIQPLLATYKSNLLACLSEQSKVDRFGIFRIQMDVANREIGELQAKLDATLDSPATKPAAPAATPATNLELTKPASPAITSDLPAANDAENTNAMQVRQFFSIPQEQLWADVFVWPGEESSHGISNEKVLSHRWRDGRLLLGLSYYGSYLNPAGGNYTGGTLGAAALFNPMTGHWDVIPYPKSKREGNLALETTYGCLEMFHDSLYLVVDNQSIIDGNRLGHDERIKKYDFKTRQWEELGIPIPAVFSQTAINQACFQLFVVNNQLFVADFESIFEIMVDGRGTHIIASTRRRPAASALDLLDNLGTPQLFPGPNDSLSASIGSQLYSWDGKDWREMFDFGFGVWGCRPDIFEGAVLFRKARPEYAPQTDETLWILQTGQSKPELCLYEKAVQGFSRTKKETPVAQTHHALWELPKGDSLINSAATFFRSNLCFFDAGANGKSGPGVMAPDKDGFRLVCLRRDCSEPIVVPLKFDWRQGPSPQSKLMASLRGDTWLEPAGEWLFIGQPDTPGVWAVSLSEVESAIARQKHEFMVEQEKILAKAAEEKSQDEQRRKAFLLKYDRNHNGIIDPDEQDAAMEDPYYVKYRLAEIRAQKEARGK